jgi:hypothetical protein
MMSPSDGGRGVSGDADMLCGAPPGGCGRAYAHGMALSLDKSPDLALSRAGC